MKKIFRLLFVWLIVLIILFATLEILCDIYILHFMDKGTFTNYASVEQIFRRVNKERTELKATLHPYKGYFLTPNYTDGCNKHNSYGFRGDELGEKKEGEIWIACLGESTTYDSDIECWEDAYPAQLEKTLNEKGIKAKVINAGVDGWTSFEILIDFTLHVSKFPVDIVIYYGGLNDVGQTRFVYPIPDNLLERDIVLARRGIDGLFNYPFWERSSLLRIFMLKAGLAIPHTDLIFLHYSPENRMNQFIIQLIKGTYPSGIFKEVSPEKILSSNPPIWFEHNIRNLILLAKSKSITPVLMTYMINTSNQNDILIVPTSPGKDILKNIMIRGINETNDVLKKLSVELNTALYDLPSYFPTENPSLFLDLVHNTPQGAHIKAELLGEYLINSGICK